MRGFIKRVAIRIIASLYGELRRVRLRLFHHPSNSTVTDSQRAPHSCGQKSGVMMQAVRSMDGQTVCGFVLGRGA